VWAIPHQRCDYKRVGFDFPLMLLALTVAGFLILVMRWVFATSRPHTGRPERGPNANLGMLRAALPTSSRAAAITAKDRLLAAGIRCSLSRVDHERYDVLVFADDLDRAQALLTK